MHDSGHSRENLTHQESWPGEQSGLGNMDEIGNTETAEDKRSHLSSLEDKGSQVSILDTSSVAETMSSAAERSDSESVFTKQNQKSL